MRKKDFLGWVLSAALLLSLSITACAADQPAGFTDVPAGSFYAGAVEYVRSYGLMEGTSDTTFEPDSPTSRAMLVTILYRQAGNPAAPQSAAYSDVERGSWYAGAVAWASSEGIADGYADGRFGPGDAVTREQLAAILWRQAGSPSPTGGTEVFPDGGAVSPYAAEAAVWAYETGLISGRESGRFDPAGYATRAETALILYRQSLGGTPGEPGARSRVLVAYFSHTGTTEGVARALAAQTGGDLFEIVPQSPYPTDYASCLEQARQELDSDARPALSAHVEHMEQYDVILLGFPIWHGNTPMPVRTFLAEYDFTGKTLAPFSTSGSSGIDSAVAAIRSLCPGAAVTDGLSLPTASLGQADTLAAEWVTGLDLSSPTHTEEDAMPALTLQIGTQFYSVTLEENDAARTLLERLPVSLTMDELNGNEKYHYLDSALPTDAATPGHIQAGDLMLYGDNCLVLFYESFPTSYRYTRLGRVDDPAGIAAALGGGSVNVTFQRGEQEQG